MVVVVASLLTATCGGSGGPRSPVPVSHEAVTFQFGDVMASGELDYPTGVTHAPVAVLVPGPSPEDMNADIGTDTVPKSHILLEIADYLTERGYAGDGPPESGAGRACPPRPRQPGSFGHGNQAGVDAAEAEVGVGVDQLGDPLSSPPA